MNEHDYALLVETLSAMRDRVEDIRERIQVLERIYGRVMDVCLRVDNLEFVSDRPVTPSIYEQMIDINHRISEIEKIVIQPRKENVCMD